MKNPCLDCTRHFPGLTYVVPDEIWRAVVGRLDAGELCPWCLDARMRAAGVTARATISLALGNLQGFSMAVLAQLEALDCRMMRGGGA